MISPAVVGLLVGAAAVFVGLGVFILPVWAGIRIRRHMKAKEERKRLMRERAAREMALQSIRGEDLRLGQSTVQGGFQVALGVYLSRQFGLEKIVQL